MTTYNIYNSESVKRPPYVVFLTRNGKTERATHLGKRGFFKTLADAQTAVDNAAEDELKMCDDVWKWPETPSSPEEVIAMFLRSWGQKLAYGTAKEIIASLAANGWTIDRAHADASVKGIGGKAA